MAGGCCRGRPRPQHNTGNRVCDELEKVGSAITAQPTITQSGVRVTTIINSVKVELFSWVKAQNCKGPTSKWILRQEEIIGKALQINPNALAKHNGQTVLLNQLSATARTSLLG